MRRRSGWRVRSDDWLLERNNAPRLPSGGKHSVGSTLARISVAVLVWLVTSCSEPPSQQPPQLDDESEVVSSVQRPSSLELLSTHDVTPEGQQAFRPDVVGVNGELWLAYNVSGAGFHLQRFDQELVALGDAVPLYSGTENAFDIRVARVQEQLWYAFESARMERPDSCEHHFLGAAIYDATDALVASAADIATGCPSTPEFMMEPTGEIPPDPEAVDDPTPFHHGGQRYVLTRAWPLYGSTVQHVRILDDELAVVDDFTLDTGPFIQDRQMEQNVLVHIHGVPYLVSGFPTGPPTPENTSELYALELSDDLRSMAEPAVLLETPEARFPSRITRGRHVNGTLIINYVDRYEAGAAREMLALYDVEDFQQLSQVQVQDHEVADNHSSFEVIDDRLYLFQQNDGERLSAKVFRLVGEDGAR